MRSFHPSSEKYNTLLTELEKFSHAINIHGLLPGTHKLEDADLVHELPIWHRADQLLMECYSAIANLQDADTEKAIKTFKRIPRISFNAYPSPRPYNNCTEYGEQVSGVVYGQWKCDDSRVLSINFFEAESYLQNAGLNIVLNMKDGHVFTWASRKGDHIELCRLAEVWLLETGDEEAKTEKL